MRLRLVVRASHEGVLRLLAALETSPRFVRTNAFRVEPGGVVNDGEPHEVLDLSLDVSTFRRG